MSTAPGRSPAAASGRVAVFLDRDGVINENRAGYVKSWAEFRILPGSVPALVRLARLQVVVVVVTNQAAVGRGLLSIEVLATIHNRLREQVATAGGRIDAIYYCPHTPADGCDCRKPAPGLFRQAAAELGLDLRRCFCVGDKLSDLEAGKAVGCQGVLVLTGEGAAQAVRAPGDWPIVADLGAAVDLIATALESGQTAASLGRGRGGAV